MHKNPREVKQQEQQQNTTTKSAAKEKPYNFLNVINPAMTFSDGHVS